MNNKVYILLDRSGSMQKLWEEAIGGINGYVKGIKDADIMLAAFDTVGYNVIRNCNVSEWKNITTEEITPMGGTPLLDAAGRIMCHMIDTQSKKAILVVVTDGEENSSSKYTSSEIKKMTKELTEKYDYEIVFLGANFDKIEDVALKNFGYTDNSRILKTSTRGLNLAFIETSTATQSYFDNGKAAEFYNLDVKNKSII